MPANTTSSLLRLLFSGLALLPAAAALADSEAYDKALETGARFLSVYPQAYLNPLPENASWGFLDWYYNANGVSSETHCDGSYRQPQVFFEDGKLPTDEQPIFATADSSETTGDQETRLKGNIYLRKGNSQIFATEAWVRHREEQAELRGNVLVREPNLLLLGGTATFDMSQGAARVEGAQFVIHDSHLRGDASAIDRFGDGRVVIHDGRYTRCQPGNDSWTINGSEIELRPETGLGSVKHATLRLSDIPVLYVPYIYFPIDDRRISGFLAPDLTYTNTSGYDISVPYYFNIAPQIDDTLTVRLVEKRGIQVENETRYLNSYGDFTLSTSWLENDNIENDDRWLFGFDHQGKPSPGWKTSIDFTRVSDDDYFDDLGTNLKINRDIHLQQHASLGYSRSAINFSLVAQDYQVLDAAITDPYAKLPQLTLWGSPKLFTSDRLQLSYLAEATRFDRNPADFTGNDRTTGDRVHLETRISAPFNWPWAFIRPEARLSHTRYAINNQPTGNSNHPERTQPLYSLDSGLFFERPVEFDGSRYTQTFEPRIRLVEAPYRDQDELPNFDSGELTFGFNQLFRDDRFSGRDRIGDTRQATFGLTSKLLTPLGAEHLSISVGQIVYFKDRRVRLDATDDPLTEGRSEYAAEAEWQVNPLLKISADGLWTSNFGHNRVRNFKIGYRSDIDHQLNANYRFTDDELEQLDLSAIWPLSPQWSLLTRWLQDIENAEPLDQIIGLEYENCCWRVRTLYRYWVNESADQRENEGLFFQFILKGLARIGTQASGDDGGSARSFLKEITGFEEREDL